MVCGTATKEDGATGGADEVVVMAAVVSRDFSITSARRLRVKLSELDRTTGFRASVLFFDARLELEGCMPVSDLASYLRF